MPIEFKANAATSNGDDGGVVKRSPRPAALHTPTLLRNRRYAADRASVPNSLQMGEIAAKTPP
jgi:hypothetical protein